MKALLSTRTKNMLFAGATSIATLYFVVSYSETGSLKLGSNVSTVKTIPEFYFTRVKNRQYSELGELKLTMTSQAITDNPSDENALIKRPILTIYQDGAPSWTAQSHRGLISSDGQHINLQRDVIIASSDQRSIVESMQLTILPDKKIAETDSSVKLLNPNGFTHAEGMHVNLRSNKISLLNNVRSQFNAPQ